MSYRVGTQKEYRVKSFLEGIGYEVIRSAKSHGFYDLIAIPKYEGDLLLIQVKSSINDGLIAEYLNLSDKIPFYCKIQIWVIRKGQHLPKAKVIEIKNGLPTHITVKELFGR